MPTYEYACRKCGQHIEVFQRISEEPLTVCGHCGGELRKVFHPAGILLKGSGFYKTDNRKKPSSSESKEPSKEPSKSSSKKSDAKEKTA
jgi:putative FmdB family regulatory protein